MKRKKLLIFGIFLSFFISCSDELERIPPTTGEVEFKDFGIRDARYYFEENATDLAPLRFTDRVARILPPLSGYTPVSHRSRPSSCLR